MLPFPNISPEIFAIDIFGIKFALRWYAVAYIAGFICAIVLMKSYLKRRELWKSGEPPMALDQADSLLTYLIIGVILGGRLGYVIFYNPLYYIQNPVSVLRIWDGGMAFHGGFLGVVIATIIYCRVHSIFLWSGADLIAIASPPGLLFGRIANFINSELWGKPTSAPWGVIFPGERAQQCSEVVGPCARHPSQLYEAGLEGVVLFLVLLFLANSGALRRPGYITGVFVLGYGLSRFTIEYFRVPDPQFFSDQNPYGYAYTYGSFGFTMGQALSVPMILAGFALALWSVKVARKL